jgi:hypothetical protein
MAIFADIRPALEHDWRSRASRNAVLKEWSAAAKARRRMKRAEELQKQTPALVASPKKSELSKKKLAETRFANPASSTIDKGFQD